MDYYLFHVGTLKGWDDMRVGVEMRVQRESERSKHSHLCPVQKGWPYRAGWESSVACPTQYLVKLHTPSFAWHNGCQGSDGAQNLAIVATWFHMSLLKR